MPGRTMLIVIHIILRVAVSGFTGIIPSALARIFPPQVRSTGTSFSYDIAAIFFAGFTPALMIWAIGFTPLATGIYVVLAGIVALLTLPHFMRMIEQRESID